MVRQGKATVLVGSQWGDEGKGRITDMLAENADVVARFSGGPNAGHTVIVGDEKYELHLIPSGILHPEKQNIIGNGTVVYPPAIVKELEGLKNRGIQTHNLFLSENAHVIMPYHLQLDRLEEERKGDDSIGTTKKGIGPTYTDKVARRGIRIGDMLDLAFFTEKVDENLAYANAYIQHNFPEEPLLTTNDIVEEYKPLIEVLRPHVADTSLMLDQARKEGKVILFEGAQGTLLDLDHGTYPFVTSSNPTAGAVCTGCGFGPAHIDEVIGIIKAYTTRVGHGPFPTELEDETGEQLRQKGHEFGVTTQRARRCGWFDIPIMKFAIRVNGLTQLALTKLDVLTGFETIKVCTHYEVNGERIEHLPTNGKLLKDAVPVYKDVPGWTEDLTDVRTFDDLPKAARDYVLMLEEIAEIPISIVSVGPKRVQAVLRTP
ncbi:MAG TPA: adenylosuccinate synthase [Myxococcales bacterium]|nr:adenylosuccinate synthase [Deltaproteobacteria bacterium]MBU50791.1 adenylosuccinate synthase [Deltaproteobacteria bacterium]HAA56550.1 adenylosuccinate synthase [Myxococcales bacterium]